MTSGRVGEQANSRLPGVDCVLDRFMRNGLPLILQQLLQSLETGDMAVFVETLLEQAPHTVVQDIQIRRIGGGGGI